jgi:hypothetical protein
MLLEEDVAMRNRGYPPLDPPLRVTDPAASTAIATIAKPPA